MIKRVLHITCALTLAVLTCCLGVKTDSLEKNVRLEKPVNKTVAIASGSNENDVSKSEPVSDLKIEPATVTGSSEVKVLNSTVTSPDGFEYEKPTFPNTSSKIKITGYSGTQTDVVIPEIISGKTVESINAGAFKDNKTITSVTINAQLTEIGSNAFSGCTSLRTANINSIKLGYRAFYGCTSLESISLSSPGIIPFSGGGYSSDIYLGDNAFENCPSLKELHIDTDAINNVTGLSVQMVGAFPDGFKKNPFEAAGNVNPVSIYFSSLPSYIKPDLFTGLNNPVIYDNFGSSVHQYAIDNRIHFVDSSLPDVKTTIPESSENKVYQYYVTPSTIISELRAQSTNIYVYDKDGYILSGSNVGVSTGGTVLLTDNNGLLRRYDIVVPGDINGDCCVKDNDDYNAIKTYMEGKSELEDTYFSAADLDGDGAVDGFDLYEMSKSIK